MLDDFRHTRAKRLLDLLRAGPAEASRTVPPDDLILESELVR
jgi:hypothetical protein